MNTFVKDARELAAEYPGMDSEELLANAAYVEHLEAIRDAADRWRRLRMGTIECGDALMALYALLDESTASQPALNQAPEEL